MIYKSKRKRVRLIAEINTEVIPQTFAINWFAFYFQETAASASEPKKTVVAQFDYSASSPMEISLEAGDIIEVLEKRSDGWWRGICRGKEGHFPSHFVVELEAIEDTNLEALKENAATGHSSSESKAYVFECQVNFFLFFSCLFHSIFSLPSYHVSSLSLQTTLI